MEEGDHTVSTTFAHNALGRSLRVYLAGPITDADSVHEGWRAELTTRLRTKYGIIAMSPMAGEDYPDRFGVGPKYVSQVLTTRDWWMCSKADVVLANFENSVKASIGTVIELGWASARGVSVLAVIPPGNIHEHPMIHSVATWVATDMEEAVGILRGLNGWL